MTYYSKRNRKQQNNRRMLILIIFALLFYFAFNLGQSKSQGNLSYCGSELEEIQNEIEETQLEKVDLQKTAETIQIEKTLLQEKYDALVSSDEVLQVFNEVNEKIEYGVEIDRIKRVVSDLKNDRKCSIKNKKRFIVKTPLYKGEIKNTNVSFEKGVFDITADGYSFINEDKKPESWFDVSKPISIGFNTKKGTELVKQELPIKKSIILKNKQYFFEITFSDVRGFVNISAHSCNYP